MTEVERSEEATAPETPAPGMPAEALVHEALAFGFSHAGPLDPGTLVPREEVRQMCAADRCQAYGRCWVCPPAIGDLDASRATIARFRSGLLVQTTAELDDPFDYETMLATDALAKRRISAFRDVLRERYPDLVALGNGACTECRTCTYPHAPCRKPDRAITSMEAFGLVVSDVCTANGLGYHHGPGTVTFTGAYLLELR